MIKFDTSRGCLSTDTAIGALKYPGWADLKNGYFLVTHPKPSGLCVSFVPLWYNVCDAFATIYHRETKEHKEIETISHHRVRDGFVTVAGKPIDPKASNLDFGPNAASIWARNNQIR